MDFKKLIDIPSYLNYQEVKKKYKKIIYVHPPQSGGNSIELFFKYNFGFRGYRVEKDSLNFFKKKFNENEIDSKILKAYYVYGHFGTDFAFSKNFYNSNYFYLFSIRNPKNRYLSNYFRNKKFYEENNNSEFISLKDFLISRKKQNLDNLYTRYLSGEFLYRENNIKLDSKNLENAFVYLKRFNQIFNIDKSTEEFLTLKKNLNIKFNISILSNLHKNKVSGSNYRELSIDEENILNELTYFDQEIYKNI